MRFCALPDAGTDGDDDCVVGNNRDAFCMDAGTERGDTVSSGIGMRIAWTLELRGVISVLSLVLDTPTALMVGLPSMA
jgi:hypothetical protein